MRISTITFNNKILMTPSDEDELDEPVVAEQPAVSIAKASSEAASACFFMGSSFFVIEKARLLPEGAGARWGDDMVLSVPSVLPALSVRAREWTVDVEQGCSLRRSGEPLVSSFLQTDRPGVLGRRHRRGDGAVKNCGI